MSWRNKLHTKVNLLITSSGELTYRTNIVYMERYCQALRYFAGYDDFNTAVDYYIDMFKKVGDLSTTKIETYFDDIVQEFFPGMINYDAFAHLKGEGVYFIYNGDDEIIYIGRTDHLDKRPLQSFICKFPLGATYLKIIETTNSRFIEAIMINQELPLYNSRVETFDTDYREYFNMILTTMIRLDKSDRIYPTSKKYDWVETQQNVFDNIEETI